MTSKITSVSILTIAVLMSVIVLTGHSSVNATPLSLPSLSQSVDDPESTDQCRVHFWMIGPICGLFPEGRPSCNTQYDEERKNGQNKSFLLVGIK